MPPASASSWRFGDTCADCQVLADADQTDFYYIPRWEVKGDTCTNCDLNAASPSPPMSDDVAWSLVAKNSTCDGWNGSWRAARNTCPESNFVCRKRLYVPGFSGAVYRTQCAGLAAADPECSNHVMFRPSAGAVNANYRTGSCYCMKTDEYAPFLFFFFFLFFSPFFFFPRVVVACGFDCPSGRLPLDCALHTNCAPASPTPHHRRRIRCCQMCSVEFAQLNPQNSLRDPELAQLVVRLLVFLCAASRWEWVAFCWLSSLLFRVAHLWKQPLTYPLFPLSPIFPPVPGTGCRPDLRHRSDFARRQHLLHRLVRLVPVGGGPERRDRVLHRRRDLGPPVLRGWPALPPRPLG